MAQNKRTSKKPSLPPQAVILDIACGMMKTQALRAATWLRIADLVADGPKSTEELAQATGTHAGALYRLLAALASMEVFEEIESGVFAQTPLSAILRPEVEGSVYSVVLLHGEPWQWRSWEAFSHSLQTGQPAFDQVYPEGLFAYFAAHPEESARFNQAMRGFSRQVDDPIATGCDFSSVKTLVDIGSGYGTLLAAILRRHPHIQGVMFDRPHVIKAAREQISSEVADRCQLVAGDMFDAQAIPPADAYIMKQIIKDWDDEQAVQILTHCRQALKPGGRIFVAEHVLLPGKQMALSKLIDLQLMVTSSGQERYETQYRALFEAAGLRLEKIWPTSTPYSVLEGKVAEV